MPLFEEIVHKVAAGMFQYKTLESDEILREPEDKIDSIIIVLTGQLIVTDKITGEVQKVGKD